MKINWFAIIFILIVLIIGISAWPDARAFLWQQKLGPQGGSNGYGQAKIQFSDASVLAQVPLTAELQEKGLGGRTGLTAGQGMVWIYDSAAEYKFWMKGMVIPIDFVWINQGQIVDITANVPPPASDAGLTDVLIYQPRQPANVVLEVSAGFAAAHHLSIGDPAEVDRL